MPEGLKDTIKEAVKPGQSSEEKKKAGDAIWGPGTGPKGATESKDGEAEDKIWGPGSGPKGAMSKDGEAEDKIWGSGPK